MKNVLRLLCNGVVMSCVLPKGVPVLINYLTLGKTKFSHSYFITQESKVTLFESDSTDLHFILPLYVIHRVDNLRLKKKENK